MEKIVLTGAAGRLGSYLREPLTKLTKKLVSSDKIENLGKLYERECYERANLEDLNEIEELTKGSDIIVHFGAFVDEAPFEKLLGPNFIGAS